MLVIEKVGLAIMVAEIAGFLIAAIIALYCGGRREDGAGAGADGSPAARVATAAPLPAPPAVVELGFFPYSAEGRRASEKLVCAICLEAFQHEDACSEVPDCRHLFHRDCVGAWMKSNATCPLCRRDVVTGSERLSVADDMV